MIFGHSHTVSEKDDGDGDGDGDAWDRFFEMPLSCVVIVADGKNAFSSVVVFMNVAVDVAINVIDSIVVVTLSSVASRHDAVIINVKTSRSRNNFGILKRDV